jgi:hypothetical protein
MTRESDLRSVIIGLISFAAAEEQILLATCDGLGDSSGKSGVDSGIHRTHGAGGFGYPSRSGPRAGLPLRRIRASAPAFAGEPGNLAAKRAARRPRP